MAVVDVSALAETVFAGKPTASSGVPTRDLEHVRDSINSGHGVLLCPNHCRDSDPMLIGMLCLAIPSHVFSMASWHIFKQKSS